MPQRRSPVRVMAVVKLTLRPVPRRVSGRWVAAAAASADVTPGTTSVLIWASRKAQSSSSRRPNRLGSPPLSRATRASAPNWAPTTRACSTSRWLMRVWPLKSLPGLPEKPRLPTSTHSASGAKSRNVGSARASYSTTLAWASRRAPRRVIKSDSPGPAPMNTTRAQGDEVVVKRVSVMERHPARPGPRSGSLDQQCAAGAVRRGVHHDQGAADAVVQIRFHRQGLLGLDLDAAHLIDPPLVRVVTFQRVDVQAGIDGRDASLHPAVAMAHPVLATHHGRFGVQPGQRGREGVGGLHRARRSDPVTEGDVDLTVQHDAGRPAPLPPRHHPTP